MKIKNSALQTAEQQKEFISILNKANAEFLQLEADVDDEFEEKNAWNFGGDIEPVNPEFMRAKLTEYMDKMQTAFKYLKNHYFEETKKEDQQ